MAAARRQLAAARIARAWRRYARSAAFAARRRALLCMQAWARGLLARRAAASLLAQRALLAALGAAVEAGQLDAVRRAEAAAAAAGLQAEAAVLVAGFQARVKAVVAQLQQAAAAGSQAEFQAARAAAARFPHLEQLALECGGVLAKRQAAAEVALREAVAGEAPPRQLVLPPGTLAVAGPAALRCKAHRSDALSSMPASTAAAGQPIAEVAQVARQARQLGVPGTRVDEHLGAAEERDGSALQKLQEAAAAQPFDAPAFEAACSAASCLGLQQEAAAVQQLLRQRREAAAGELLQLASSCPDAAAVLARAAAAEALGASREAREARQQLQQRQQQHQLALLRAAASGGAAQVQELLQAAQLLQLPEAVLQEAQQVLQARQHEAEQRLAAAAAGTASAGQVEAREAARAARLLGCPEAALQAAAAALRQRQQEAAGKLRNELQRVLAALQPGKGDMGAGVADALAALARHAATALLHLTTGSSSGSDIPSAERMLQQQQHRLQRHLGSQQCSQLGAALQQLMQQAQQCCRLGLAATSTSAAAVALQTQAQLLISAGELRVPAGHPASDHGLCCASHDPRRAC